MKGFLEFVKTTILGGFFVLLPILLVYLMMAELLEAVVALATPIADLFPTDTFEKINFPVVIAVVLIVSVSFVLGLGMRAEIGRRTGRWLERRTLRHLPAYNALKNLAMRLGDIKEGGAFTPVLLVSGDGHKEIAYLIEDPGNGEVTIMLPWAPTPLAGSVKIVPRDQIEALDASLGDVTRVLSHWGVGASELLGRKD